MKLKSTLLKITIILFFSVFTAAVHAQTATPATPFSTPSDTTTAPPATAAAVNKVLCAGGQISLKGLGTAVSTNKYQWFKVDLSGQKKLVKETTGDNTYT